MFNHISKHLEVCQKYSATRWIFSSLLGVWKFIHARSFVKNQQPLPDGLLPLPIIYLFTNLLIASICLYNCLGACSISFPFSIFFLNFSRMAQPLSLCSICYFLVTVLSYICRLSMQPWISYLFFLYRVVCKSKQQRLLSLLLLLLSCFMFCC